MQFYLGLWTAIYDKIIFSKCEIHKSDIIPTKMAPIFSCCKILEGMVEIWLYMKIYSTI